MDINELRAHNASAINDRICRPNNGRSILYDVSAGLGKTHAMMDAIGNAVRAFDKSGQPGTIIACWHSVAQMMDAVTDAQHALRDIEVLDPLNHVPPGWENGGQLGQWFGIPALIYRGKSQLCRLTDKTKSCFGCGFYRECAYTWQDRVLETKLLRLVLGPHALLKGETARKLARVLNPVIHLLIDEDNGAGIIDVEIGLLQLRDVMRMCAWQLGATGYPDLTTCVASLTGNTTHSAGSAVGQANVIMDALNAVRNTGVIQGDWNGLLVLLGNIINEPVSFSGEDGYIMECAHRDALNAVRARHGDTTPHVAFGTQTWNTGMRSLRDLHKIIELFISPHEQRKVVMVGYGDSARAMPRITASWIDTNNYFMGLNGQPADYHYFNATPTTHLIKRRAGLIDPDPEKTEHLLVRVADDNLRVRLYSKSSVFNGPVREMIKPIMYLVDKALREQGGETLLVLPTARLAAQYQRMFSNRPEVHVTYIQILAGVNAYEQCNSVVVAGNFIPGTYGLTDLATLVYGLPMLLRMQLADGRPFEPLQPGAAAGGADKLLTFNKFYGHDLTDIADAMIGDQIWQAIQRTRPINKRNPVHAYLLTNFDFAGYVQRKGYVVDIESGNLTTEMQVVKVRSANSTIGRVDLMVKAAGGFLFDLEYLQARRMPDGKAVFHDSQAVYDFIREVHPTGRQRGGLTEYLNSNNILFYTLQYGRFNEKELQGMFSSQEAANAVMCSFVEAAQLLEQRTAEAAEIDMHVLENEILRQLRSSFKPLSELIRVIAKKVEYRNVGKIALSTAITAQLGFLVQSGRVEREGRKYRLVTM